MDMLVRGRHVITDPAVGDPGVLEDGAVLVSGSRIAAVGAWAALRRRHPRARVVGNGKQLLMPGLVDAHSHGRALSPIQKGVLNDYLENNLLDWAFMPVFDPELMAALGRLAPPAERLHDDPPHGVRHGGPAGARPLREGHPHLPATAVSGSPSRPGCGTWTSWCWTPWPSSRRCRRTSRPSPSPWSTSTPSGWRRSTSRCSRICTGASRPRTRACCSRPSWAQAVTESFLLRAKATADRLGKVPIHMHCVQTPIQRAFSFRKYGKSAVAWLDELGLVDENLALGHAIWVSEDDIDRLATRRASITSHPSCNLGMRNGLAPIYAMHRRGVNVAMGLDDKTINDDEDAVMELRMLHKLHRVPDYDLRTPALTAHEVLRMGTVNGARALGFGGRDRRARARDEGGHDPRRPRSGAARPVAHRGAAHRGGVHPPGDGPGRVHRDRRRPGGDGGPADDDARRRRALSRDPQGGAPHPAPAAPPRRDAPAAQAPLPGAGTTPGSRRRRRSRSTC